MSDTVKVIIEIPESIFDAIQADEMISREQLAILQIHILNGIPLDDVKAEWVLVVDREDEMIKEQHWECSKCGSGKSGWGEYKFCPDCGAEMSVKNNC